MFVERFCVEMILSLVTITGKNCEHRREWVEDRLLFLTSVYAIDVCAYAVMSNHVHTVLHVSQKKQRQEKAVNWTTKEVLERWHRLHKGTVFTQQYIRGDELPEYALQIVNASAETYRNRLIDISWFIP